MSDITIKKGCPEWDSPSLLLYMQQENFLKNKKAFPR